MQINKPRILCVDDDQCIGEILPLFIQQLLGPDAASIQLAHSGNEAIELLKQGQAFDLIVSDYTMDNGSGADLMAFLHVNYVRTPFILFSGTQDPIFPYVCENFVGIVQKPHGDKLLEAITQALRIPMLI